VQSVHMLLLLLVVVEEPRVKEDSPQVLGHQSDARQRTNYQRAQQRGTQLTSCAAYMLLSLLSSLLSVNPRVRMPSSLFPHLILTADTYSSPGATHAGRAVRALRAQECHEGPTDSTLQYRSRAPHTCSWLLWQACNAQGPQVRLR
jgi:hypothetical protein